MKNKEDLKKELIKIDHKSYGMYKTLGGSYSFGNYILYIDHVQGDPFASPSRLHFEVKRDRHGFPEEYYQEKHRRLALEDQVLRRFLYELRQIDKGFMGSGKSGRITICPANQTVQERIAVVFSKEKMELRFEMGFPARGRTILAKEMQKLVFDILPQLAENTLFYRNWDTKNRNTMSQMFSMKAIQLIYDNLEKAVNEKDQEAINNMGLGQYIAGMAFSNVGLGIVHSMAHQLGAVYDTPHGLANAILLPTVMKFNGEVSYEQYREILTQAFHTDATKFTKEEVIKTFCEKIKDLSEKVGITQTVRDVGGKEEDIPMLADKAMEDPCKPGNPREVTKEDFIRLYEEAM